MWVANKTHVGILTNLVKYMYGYESKINEIMYVWSYEERRSVTMNVLKDKSKTRIMFENGIRHAFVTSIFW